MSEFVSLTSRHLDLAVVVVMVLCGAWNFWFEGPALAERGFAAEARLAARGGLAMILMALAVFLASRFACALLGV